MPPRTRRTRTAKKEAETVPVSACPRLDALPPQRAPLCIYVAWHPRSEDGEHLARRIFRWFRGDPFDLEACATGVPVMFRSWPLGEHVAPRPLPTADQDRIRVLVPLVDEHLVVSKTWRHYIHANVARAKSDGNLIVLPVALHPGAFELSGAVALLNFLRADGTGVPADETVEARRQRREARIRNQLTDALGRLLEARGGFHGQFESAPAKVSVFVSHAKVDGSDCASALRDEIQRRAQLDAFYDESDLPYGFDYASGLDQALREGNALLLAVLSDQYASRPWCRHELRSMRALHELDRAGPDSARICKVAPVVVVDALEKGSVDHLPEIGPAPVLRWRDGVAPLVVDSVLRQVLQYAHDLKRARDVAQLVAPEHHKSTWVINGTPDLRLVAEVRVRAKQAEVKEPRLVFPGPGVLPETLEDWRRLFPEMQFERFDDLEVLA